MRDLPYDSRSAESTEMGGFCDREEEDSDLREKGKEEIFKNKR